VVRQAYAARLSLISSSADDIIPHAARLSYSAFPQIADVRRHERHADFARSSLGMVVGNDVFRLDGRKCLRLSWLLLTPSRISFESGAG